MTLIAFIFQILGMFAAVFLASIGVGFGLRLGLGKPLSRTELERRKDLGKPF